MGYVIKCYNEKCYNFDEKESNHCRVEFEVLECPEYNGKNGLLPCPFCGNEAGINEFLNRPTMYSVECKNCNSTQGLFDEESEAIESWNGRA